MMYGMNGWHGAIIVVMLVVWLIVAAAVLFALYWTIRLAITHALRARDRERMHPQGGSAPHPGSAGYRPDDPTPPVPGPPPAPPAA